MVSTRDRKTIARGVQVPAHRVINPELQEFFIAHF
jgi:hypothetical protein